MNRLQRLDGLRYCSGFRHSGTQKIDLCSGVHPIYDTPSTSTIGVVMNGSTALEVEKLPLESIDVSDASLYQNDSWRPYFARLSNNSTAVPLHTRITSPPVRPQGEPAP